MIVWLITSAKQRFPVQDTLARFFCQALVILMRVLHEQQKMINLLTYYTQINCKH
jgi:hypothetical protein